MADADAVRREQRGLRPSLFSLAPADEALIREAAREALGRSFPRLNEERVLPRSRYRPWIWMARDYYGHAVEVGEGPLAKAFEAALPERFERSKGPSIDFPWNYSAALLEAAVAAATLADEPYDVASPSVQATIDELIEKVRAVPRAAVVQLVADVDVAHPPLPEGHQDHLGETMEVAGARVIRVENEAERFIERELPSAGYEVERSQVVVHPGPAALLVGTAEMRSDYEARVTEARRRVRQVLTAIRLATGSTAHAVVDIAGEPDRVRWIHPSITPLPSWGFRFAHRPVTLGETDVMGLESLTSLIASWGDDPNWSAVRLALGRLSRSLNGHTPGLADQAVDLAIGLEAALAGTDKTEIGLRLRTRAAEILTTDADPPEAIYRDVKTLYDLRSTIVHGASLSAKAVNKAIRSVTGAAAASWPAEQYLLALDRWRDLLRRAVLARIALSTAAVPWAAGAKGGGRLDVDELLLRDSDRNAWRQHVRAFWAGRGLPHAPDPPSSARLTIGGASSPATEPG
ncbi:MAG: hypothetical protein ACR2NO_05895 [Chloroflexota bacterium]